MIMVDENYRNYVGIMAATWYPLIQGKEMAFRRAYKCSVYFQ